MKKRFLFSILIFLLLAGCAPQPPAYPTPDRCLGLHTIGLPECSPPSSLPATLSPRAESSPFANFPEATQSSTLPEQVVTILVDDFAPQPYQGDTVYFYNRLEGDRGALNGSAVAWGEGQATVILAEGQIWGGLWMSLNHPIRERQSLNFSAVLPAQILPQYQSRITGITISIAGGTPLKIFRAELKDSANNLHWSHEMVLNGGQQTMSIELPSLQNLSQLVVVLDHASAGDFVVIDNISLAAVTPITDPALAAFVWSYGMLLNNWDPETGLVRDKARDASGEFDAVQATGSLAAATALADQIGIIARADAIAIVEKIGDTLLTKLPRKHGLWPHWVRNTAGAFEIVYGTEWSSIDTVIAAIGLLVARQSLGLETSATEQMLREIEWNNLLTEKGISHGYTYDDQLIPYAWDVFGSESWLVGLAYASATGQVAPLAYPSVPTANGSGFIDELAWLYVRPPTSPDAWGTDWVAYRADSVERQTSYYVTNEVAACFAQQGLFGLSAGEVPVPARVPKGNIYQAFGVGGQFSSVNDGIALMGVSVMTPHYSAMIALLEPEAAIRTWDWLIARGYLTPLNNVESLTFPAGSACDTTLAEWNHLKGSWNLALQTLGWGIYLAEHTGQVPVVWQATLANPFLKKGYLLLAPNE